MNLLEVVTNMSAATHAAKEHIAANGGPHEGCVCKDDYCRAEIPPALTVFRGGHQIAAMTLADGSLGYALTVAARMFAADAIAVALDGRDKRTDRPVIATAAVNRAGDEMWRVEPYSLAPDGRTVLWWPAEVPHEHPILETSVADMFVKYMNKPTMPWPPHMHTPGLSFEARQTCVDIGITKQIARHANESYANIAAVSLAALPGTEREKLLDMAGHNPVLWL